MQDTDRQISSRSSRFVMRSAGGGVAEGWRAPTTWPGVLLRWVSPDLPGAVAATVEQALTIDPELYSAGELVEAKLGHLEPESTYYIGVRAVAECQAAGPIAMTTVETTQIEYATVSPCFVATATYGTPMAEEIGVLRRFRDRYLMNNAPGRALVEAYYEHGPDAAAAIREDSTLRAMSRGWLTPVVAFAEWMTE